MKKRAAETREKTPVIMAQTLRRLPEEASAQMISSEHLKRTLYTQSMSSLLSARAAEIVRTRNTRGLDEDRRRFKVCCHSAPY